MAKQMPKAEEGNAQEWLNTYADMVTLLLTFFVLLFACSNLDETKLQFVFQEFKSRGKYINNVVAEKDPYAENEGGVSDNTDENGGEGTMPESFEELYVYLAEFIDNENLAESVAVENGEAHIKITFDSSVFFDGDSYILKQEGRKMLDRFIPAIRAVKQAIRKCTVTGHTSVGTSAVWDDWSLSSNRAKSVIYYLEDGKMLENNKYRLAASGPYEPVSEDPAKNRRVELLLLKNELDLTDINVIKDILKYDYGLDPFQKDPDDQNSNGNDKLPPDAADKIISFIKDKFNNGSGTSIGSYGPVAVDGDKFIVKNESGGTNKPSAGGDDSGGDTSAD